MLPNLDHSQNQLSDKTGFKLVADVVTNDCLSRTATPVCVEEDNRLARINGSLHPSLVTARARGRRRGEVRERERETTMCDFFTATHQSIVVNQCIGQTHDLSIDTRHKTLNFALPNVNITPRVHVYVYMLSAYTVIPVHSVLLPE